MKKLWDVLFSLLVGLVAMVVLGFISVVVIKFVDAVATKSLWVVAVPAVYWVGRDLRDLRKRIGD